MHLRLHILPIAIATLLVTFGPNRAAPRYHYTYFDRRIPLTLDPTQIAIESATRELDITHSALGEANTFAIPNWQTLSVAPQATHDIQSIVREVAAANDRFVSPVFVDTSGRPLRITRELFVRFDTSVDAQAANTLAAQYGDVVESNACGLPGVYRLRSHSNNGFVVLADANRLAERADVIYAEPDMIVSPVTDLTPTDPQYGTQWGLHNTGQSGGTLDIDVNAPEAWDIATGDPTVVIAVFDDGVQQDHPDINQIPGIDYTGTAPGGGPGNSCDNHGTVVAGAACQTFNNLLGGAGIAGNCNAISMKWTVANVPCDGGVSAQTSWLASGLGYCAANGIRVTALAYGMGPSSLVTDAYNASHAAGVVHFATTGNGAPTPYHYPATLATVNAVGAIDRFGLRASFSQYGNGMSFVAPGVSIHTTDRTGRAGYIVGDYHVASGTSMACPFAAGVGALLVSYAPNLTSGQIDQILEQTCKDVQDPGYDDATGYGLLNARDALALAATVAGTNGDLPVPGTLRITGAPNPFRAMTAIHTSLDGEGPAAIRIYDVGGRLVRDFHRPGAPPGNWIVEWNGRSQGGQRVAGGVYFLQVEQAGRRSTSKITLIR